HYSLYLTFHSATSRTKRRGRLTKLGPNERKRQIPFCASPYYSDAINRKGVAMNVRLCGSFHTMNLRQLQYFVEVGEIGSVTKAAARLNIAQPALTRHIRSLERDL